MKKSLYLTKYYKTIFTNLTHSKFVKKNIKHMYSFSTCQFVIGHNELNISQYLYLYLLCEKKPVISKQNKSRLHPFKLSNKKEKFKFGYVYLKSRQLWKTLHFVLTNIVLYQPIAEKKVFQLKKNRLMLYMENLPLIPIAMKLQSPNHYITQLPFCISFVFKNISLFEKICFARNFKFLKTPLYIKNLSKI